VGHDAGGREWHVNARWRLRHRAVFLWCAGSVVLRPRGVGCLLVVRGSVLAFSWRVGFSLCLWWSKLIYIVSGMVSQLRLGRVPLGCSYPWWCLGYWLGLGGVESAHAWSLCCCVWSSDCFGGYCRLLGLLVWCDGFSFVLVYFVLICIWASLYLLRYML
jgi:hypothetical protein